MTQVPPTVPDPPNFHVEPAPWVWDHFFSQPNYPPKPEGLVLEGDQP